MPRLLWSPTVLLAACLGGCATMPRDVFTRAEHDRAVIAGFDDVRFPAGDPAATRALRAVLALHEQTGATFSVLALSGGGANGAYGAGVLCGWTRAGDRPRFSVVTGVSTGALIAPFAYLGPAWDPQLRHAYTSGAASRLIGSPGLRPLTKDSVFSGKPLRHLIDTYVTDDLIRAVAAEHATGRLLLVATADLDSERLVVWNMGAIAARRLFAAVLVASAAIPGVFPPVMIPATAGGRTFHEMHVDGTTINAFFAVPDAALLLRERPPVRNSAIYILINGKADEEFEVTQHALLPVVARSYDAASKAAQRTALTALAAFGQANGVATQVTAIPAAERASALDFSRDAMNRLFALGEQRVLDAKAWTDLGAALERSSAAGIGGSPAAPPSGPGDNRKRP